MKVCVLGLWHLGSVISACIASKNHFVIGIDENLANIKNLNKNKAPIFEPGLNELIKKRSKIQKLNFY
jgi:UDPglucose 6-dehydrogenase